MECHNFDRSLNFIVNKSHDRMRWGWVTKKFRDEKPERRRSVGIPRLRWAHSSGEMAWRCTLVINFSAFRSCGVLNFVIKFWVPKYSWPTVRGRSCGWLLFRTRVLFGVSDVARMREQAPCAVRGRSWVQPILSLAWVLWLQDYSKSLFRSVVSQLLKSSSIRVASPLLCTKLNSRQ
jgi:hypothetical protein